jgi:NAD(P)-dependent dehydrogenase (short-subunit alcohol dehydrogenase family)
LVGKWFALCIILRCVQGQLSQLLLGRLEMNFAVNVAGVYALTELLIPALEKAAPEARVITVSSGGMYTEPLSTFLQVLC